MIKRILCHPVSLVDLRNANLNDANLHRAKLINSDLSGATLRRANLISVDLRGAILRNVDFEKADLSRGNLSGAKLQGTSFNGTLLWNTNFTGAVLTNTNFHASQLADTVFYDNDLSLCVDLDKVVVFGECHISVGTLFKSQGAISEIFLRNAGMSDRAIGFNRDIREGPPNQWLSCFISYSTKDEEFARRLHSRMRKANMRVWFAPEDLKGGKKLYEQLFDAIQIHDRLLIVLSEHSIQSEWVMTEIRKARATEKKGETPQTFSHSADGFRNAARLDVFWTAIAARIWPWKCASISSPIFQLE